MSWTGSFALEACSDWTGGDVLYLGVISWMLSWTLWQNVYLFFPFKERHEHVTVFILLLLDVTKLVFEWM